MSVIKMLL